MKRFEIDENWQFRVRPSGTDDGDGLWQDVRLPHDAMISSARGVGEPSSTGGAFFAGQTVQYRRIIEVPDEWRGNAVIQRGRSNQCAVCFDKPDGRVQIQLHSLQLRMNRPG